MSISWNTQLDNTQVEYLIKYSTWVDQADKFYILQDLFQFCVPLDPNSKKSCNNSISLGNKLHTKVLFVYYKNPKIKEGHVGTIEYLVRSGCWIIKWICYNSYFLNWINPQFNFFESKSQYKIKVEKKWNLHTFFKFHDLANLYWT